MKKDDPQFLQATRLHRAGKLAEATRLYRALLLRDPGHSGALTNLGIALAEAKQHDAAIAAYGRAIACEPESAGPHTNLGNTLRRTGRPDLALPHHEKAVALEPKNFSFRYNLALSLRDLGRPAEAIEIYDALLAEQPDNHDLRFDRALALLTMGDLKDGFPAYEACWRLDRAKSRDLPPETKWDGAPLGGRTILLYATQGMGDTLQFCRYVPMVAALGGKVVLQVQAPLLGVLETLAGVERLVAEEADPGPHDLHYPLLSLPVIFGTTLDDVPAHVPYLSADPGRRPPLPDIAPFRLGLVWAGKPTHGNDFNRSLGLKALLPLLDLPGIAFYSLQMGPRRDDLKRLGLHGLITDLSGAIGDFADTAALLTQLDLLITVDTSPLHLAGALGRPAWGLLPYAGDWRWLLDRSDTPWYPSLRLFRPATPGDTDGMMARVRQALAEASAQKT